MDFVKKHLSDPFYLGEESSAQVSDQVNDQVGDQLVYNKILLFCKDAKRKKEICEHLGYSNLTYFIRKFIAPLIAEGKLDYTVPDKPNSREQKYI